MASSLRSNVLSKKFTRNFCASSVSQRRAVVFSEPGKPLDVLTCLTLPRLPPPPPHTANVNILLSPINPADINVIEGVYPSRPNQITLPAGRHVFTGGNEGLAEVTEVGEGVIDLQEHDWIVLAKPQQGTWTSSMNVPINDLLRVSRKNFLSNKVIGATITVNPPTAYNMLHDYVHLEEGEWLLQNGANSAVGQAVIQIAASMGIKTINFVRNRKDIVELTTDLKNLGATHVLTYDILADKNFRKQLLEWTSGKHIRLGLNCIGGRETMLMARLLGQDAHLVSYGGMSKQPLSLPPSHLIFKNLKCHGFWQTRWYNEHSHQERAELMNKLMELVASGKLKEPKHEIITIGARCTDDKATDIVRGAVKNATEGRYGRKVLLRIEDPLAEKHAV